VALDERLRRQGNAANVPLGKPRGEKFRDVSRFPDGNRRDAPTRSRVGNALRRDRLGDLPDKKNHGAESFSRSPATRRTTTCCSASVKACSTRLRMWQPPVKRIGLPDLVVAADAAGGAGAVDPKRRRPPTQRPRSPTPSSLPSSTTTWRMTMRQSEFDTARAAVDPRAVVPQGPVLMRVAQKQRPSRDAPVAQRQIAQIGIFRPGSIP